MFKSLFLSFILCYFSLSLEASNKFYASLGKNGQGYYSQYGQDRFLNNHLFQGKKDGIFIDVGAHDGISFSNSKYFEEIGWTGICIEPIPDVYEELKKNRSAICIQGCISDKVGKASFLRVHGYSEMLSGLMDNYDPRHLNRIHSEISNPHNEGSAQLIEVDCYLLNDILKNNNLSHVDFLALDVEGGELNILKSIDFDTYTIDVIVVENNFQYWEIRQFLTTKGYSLVTVLGVDEIYKLR